MIFHHILYGFSVLLVSLFTLLPSNALAQGSKADYQRAADLARLTQGKVFRDKVKPHWMPGGDAMWYCNVLSGGEREYVLVDAVAGSRKLAFDHDRLAKALTEAIGKPLDAKRLDIKDIQLPQTTGEEASCETTLLLIETAGKHWQLDLATYTLTEQQADKDNAADDTKTTDNRRSGSRSYRSSRSPDGRWEVAVRDSNVVLRDLQAPGDDSESKSQAEFQLTNDGTEQNPYTMPVTWSPDSCSFALIRREKPQEHKVYLIESSPKVDKKLLEDPDENSAELAIAIQPKLDSYEYLKPGDKIAHPRVCLFRIDVSCAGEHRQIPVEETLAPNPWSIGDLHWSADSQRLHYLYNQRGHQVLRIVEVQAETGETRAIIDEKSDTFINYAYYEYTRHLDATDEIIWMSERSGWNHLYLIDAKSGDVKNAITQGDWVVRGVDRIDEQKRQIWFHASGIHPEQDPYYIHYCRVDFDGSNLTLLTEGDGTHEIEYSPDSRYLIDRYSRVDMAPVSALRKVDDGSLVCNLEQGDMTALQETGWQPPERFTAKGRDGETDIYGVIWRPTNFDSKKTYPVIEYIYAGPHGSFTPKSFRTYYRVQQQVSELGFIIVQCDGMGTSHRSKAFHDVCWKNLKDSGFPDRLAWIKAAAAKYPEMEISRVGIYGGSAGGQSAMRGMLDYPGFYQVGVADCGCHDNRMDKIWWNEAWMGWPIGPEYAASSNVVDAHKLQGKLMLVVGELDRNVDPSSTLQVVDALIKADKDFDFLLVPGAGHGAAESRYGSRRRQDFFVRHLLGKEPRWESGDN